MDIAPYAIVMLAGLFIGVAGHIMRSRPLILVGIALVGIASVLFGYVVARVR
jgi:hypothetical protein